MTVQPQTTNPIDVRLGKLLLEKGVAECPTYGRKIDRGMHEPTILDDPKTTDTPSMRCARALLDRCRTTTGYYRWSSHNPPPSMQEMVEAIEALLTEMENTN